MYSQEITYFIVLTVIILSSPFLPSKLLILLDNTAIRIGIVLLLLYLINIGPTAGIFGLLAISILYLERNRHKVAIAVKKLDMMDMPSSYASVKEAGTPQKTVPVAEFDLPQLGEVDFLPHETCDSSNFEPIAPTINQKVVLSSAYPLQQNGSSVADELYEQLGFGHIYGVETRGNNE